MKELSETIIGRCPSDEIAAYVDGELDLMKELELEAHFATCSGCRAELNEQKQLVCGLSSTLKNDLEIDLPANFTRNVVANAESTVAGLRRPRERYNAVFVCAGLFLFAIFAMGPDAVRWWANVYSGVEQTAIVGGIIGDLIYSIFLGVVVVLRSLASQMHLDLVGGLAFITLFVVTVGLISMKVLRTGRA